MDNKEKLMTEEEWLAKYNASQKKSKRKNVRKWVRNGVALGLVAVLSIAGTLAYLSKKSAEKTNTFTGSAGLKLMLTESAWDLDNDDTADTNEPMKEAETYITGHTYAKNPQLINWNTNTWNNIVKNSSTKVVENSNSGKCVNGEDLTGYTYNEYVAIKVELLGKTDGSTPGDNNKIKYSLLKNVIDDIVLDNNWTLIQYFDSSDNKWKGLTTGVSYIDSNRKLTSQLDNATAFVFAYGSSTDSSGWTHTYTELQPGTVTSSLFSGLKIKDTITKNFANADVDYEDRNSPNFTDSAFPAFKLKITGAAVDTNTTDFSGSTSSSITTALLKLLDAETTT